MCSVGEAPGTCLGTPGLDIVCTVLNDGKSMHNIIYSISRYN